MITAERLQPNASNEQLPQTPADALANRIQRFNSPNFALAMVNAAGSALYEDTDRAYASIRSDAQELGLSSVREHYDYESFRQKREALRDIQQLASDIEQSGSVRGVVRAQRDRQMARRIAESRPYEVHQVDATAVQPRIEIKRSIDGLRERFPLENMYAGMRSVAGRLVEKARDAKDIVVERYAEKKRQIGRVALAGALLVGAVSTVMPSENHNAAPVAEASFLRRTPSNLTSDITRPTPGTVPVETGRTVESTPTTNAPVTTTIAEKAPAAVNLSALVAEAQAENARRAAEEEAARVVAEAEKAAAEAAAAAKQAALLAPHSEWLSNPDLDSRIVSVYEQLALRGHDFVITSTNGGKHSSGSRHYSGHAIDSVDINGVELTYGGFNKEVLKFLDDVVDLIPRGKGCQVGLPNIRYVNYVQEKLPDCYVFVDIGSGPHIHIATAS